MRILAAVFLCLFFITDAPAQTERNEEVEARVESIALFRDDGGEAGEETAVFLTTDVPVHCSVGLTSRKPATVKMTLVAVKADGLRPETKIVTVAYKTNGKQNIVNFTAAPEKTWAAGVYRVDIFIDGKLDKSREFEVKKNAAKAESGKPAPPKPAPKPKTRAPKRKN